MKFTLDWPGRPIHFHYDETVYSPKYTQADVVAIGNKLGIDGFSVLDVGCGSGVLGLSLKVLNPKLDLILCDVAPEAIKVTRKNAKRLKLDVKIRQNTPDQMVDGVYDMIVANLPTFTEDQMNLAVNGPEVAYFAGEDGLSLYCQLFAEAKGKTFYLVVECQKRYQEELLKLAEKLGWVLILRTDFGFAFQPRKKEETSSSATG